MNKRFVPAPALIACMLLVASCQTDRSGRSGLGTRDMGAGRETGLVAPAETHAFMQGALAAKNPLDVVVLPIEPPEGRRNLPLAMLRTEFAQGLVRLRYSPLALDYVDQRVVDASYAPGAMSEGAVFRVVLRHWDDSMWRSRGKIDVRAEVHMLDPQSPKGTPLWGGPIQTTLIINPRRDNFTTDAQMLEAACDQFVEQVLTHLPPRRPEAGS